MNISLLQRLYWIGIFCNVLLVSINVWLVALDRDYLKSIHKCTLYRINEEHHRMMKYSRIRKDVLQSYNNIETLLNMFGMGEKYYNKNPKPNYYDDNPDVFLGV